MIISKVTRETFALVIASEAVIGTAQAHLSVLIHEATISAFLLACVIQIQEQSSRASDADLIT